MLECAGGLLSGEIEDQISGGEEAGGVAGQDRFVDQVFGNHGLAEPVRGDDDHVLALREKVQREDALDRRPMDRRRLVPFPIGHRLEAAEASVAQTPVDALPQSGLELGVRQAFELDDGTPPLLRGAGYEIIELARGVDEAELPQLITQRRRNRIG